MAALTVAQISLHVKRQFGDEAGAQITDADVIRWVNDAQRELALNNNLLQVRATTTLVATQTEYSLPTDILTLHSIKFKGVSLMGISLQEADALISTADPTTGRPTHYWMWANGLSVYPTPDSSVVDVITLYYTRQPVDVVNTTDYPELPVQYHNRIKEFCLAQAYELDDNLQGAQMKMGQFTQGADKLKDNESWQQRDVYPSITVGADDTQAEGLYYAW